MSKEEAERLQQARDNGATSEEISRVSEGIRRESVERTMQAAENEARNSGPEPHARTLATMWDPNDINSLTGPSTLPIVDEAGEAGSQKSGRSRQQYVRSHLDPTGQMHEKPLPVLPTQAHN